MRRLLAEGARPPLTGLPVLRADERFLDALAERVATRVVERLERDSGANPGFLDSEGAAGYLGTSRRRIHELTSAGMLRPDGRDGRRPLYRPESLDRYAEGRGEGDGR